MAKCILIKGGLVLQEISFITQDILIKETIIEHIGKEIPIKEEYKVIDARGLTILPGFVDIHTHGGAMVDFNRAHKEDVVKVSRFFASCGVTSFYATVLTDTIETLKQQLDIISSVETENLRGIHLEGPFLSALYKGAMPEELLRLPDTELFNELQKVARGKIKIITLAPELPGSNELIKELTKSGVVVSIGHSNASYEKAREAIECGALSTTHIMNAMKLLHMHDPGILSAALEGDTYAEMICDGYHLHPPIIRVLLKIKGLDRMIAVTDSTMAAGCGDGNYMLGKHEVIVVNGDAKLKSNGVRAGSTLTLDKALRNLDEFTHRPIHELINLVSTNALTLLNLNKERGSLKERFIADITLLNENKEVIFTIAQGNIIYDKEHNG